MWTKAPLRHKGRLPSLATATAQLRTWPCHGSELFLLENQTLSMSNGPKQDRFQPHRDRHEAEEGGKASRRKERIGRGGGGGNKKHQGAWESYAEMVKKVEGVGSGQQGGAEGREDRS